MSINKNSTKDIEDSFNIFNIDMRIKLFVNKQIFKEFFSIFNFWYKKKSNQHKI